MIDPNHDRGLFLSLLDEMSRPGQIIRNLLHGNLEGAGRQAAQLGLNTVDSVLPGDWLPNDVARPEDYISGKDLVGADDSLAGHALGFGVDLLTDPLTYVPGAAVAKGLGKAGELASAGVKLADKVLPGTANAVAKGGIAVRSAMGNTSKIAKPILGVMDEARNAGGLDAQAALASAKKALGGLDERQRRIVGDAMDNFKWGPDGKLAGELVPSSADPIRGIQSGTLADRIAAHPEVDPAEIEKLSKAAEDVATIGRSMRDRKGVFAPGSEGPIDPVTGIRQPVMQAPGALPDQYLGRGYEGLPEQDALDLLTGAKGGTPNAMKGIKLKEWEDVANFLGKKGNEGVTYQRDALTRLANRAAQQGTLATRADVGQGILKLLRDGTMKLPDQMLVDEASKLGAKGASLAPDVYGIGKQSGKAVVGDGEADIGAMLGGEGGMPAAVDPYGTVLGQGGKAAAALPDVNAMLGGARAEAAPIAEDITQGGLNIGDQTGKSAVGESAKQTPLGINDIHPNTLEQAKDSLLNKDFAYGDPESKKLIQASIAHLAKSDPETAKALQTLWGGMAPRNGAMQAWVKLTAPWKRAVITGFLMPQFGKIFRNRLNALPQAYANPETRSAVMGSVKTLIPDMIGAVSDAVGSTIGNDKWSTVLKDWEGALGNSGGDTAKAIAEISAKHPEEARVIKAGGLDGMVRAEEMIKEAHATGFLKKAYRTAMDWPAKIYGGVESRMRGGMAMDLMKQNDALGTMTAEEAAKKAVRDTGEALFKYDVNSPANRALRDVFPFIQYANKAIPQSAALLADKPWLASAYANSQSPDDGDPTYPFMDGRFNVNLGHHTYVNGFGLPEEALSILPNPSAGLHDIGREIEQQFVGQSNPVVKGLYSVVSGRDPAFGTPFGQFGHLPGNVDAGAFGKALNTADAFGLPGLSQATTLMRSIGHMTDDRTGLSEKALETFTGAHLVNVDPERAKQMRLTDALNNNPDIMKAEVPMNPNHDPDVQQMIDELKRVRQQQKQKRMAEAAKGDIIG